jgi:predicted transposase/invertase (TIGR01784 family)
MRFIIPRTDFAFKKIFGSDQSKAILISFPNAVLYQDQPVIVDLEIIDPYLAPKIQGMKDTFVDVRARLRNGRTVIIEMQVLNVEGFEKRVLYNAAKSYSTQLLAGEDYKALRAVVALTITDFVMFPDSAELQSTYVLKEKSRLTDYPEGDLELVFVELPKFTKSLEQLETVKDKWLYFLRKAQDLQMIPETMQTTPEVRAAFEIASEANMSAEELDIQDRKITYIRDQRGIILKATNEALARGTEEGRKEGLEEGMEKGRDEMAKEIALRLLPRLNDQQIAETTGLSLAEVAALRQGSETDQK